MVSSLISLSIVVIFTKFVVDVEKNEANPTSGSQFQIYRAQWNHMALAKMWKNPKGDLLRNGKSH